MDEKQREKADSIIAELDTYIGIVALLLSNASAVRKIDKWIFAISRLLPIIVVVTAAFVNMQGDYWIIGGIVLALFFLSTAAMYVRQEMRTYNSCYKVWIILLAQKGAVYRLAVDNELEGENLKEIETQMNRIRKMVYEATHLECLADDLKTNAGPQGKSTTES